MTVRLSTGKIKARLAPLATAFIDITVCDLGSSERTCIRRHKGNKEGLVQYISTYAGYQYTDVFTWYLVHNILTLRLHFPAQLLWSEVLPSAAFWASCGHRCMSFVLPPGINMPSVFIAQRGSAFPLLVDLHRTLYQLTLSRFRRRNKTKHKGLVCKYTSRGSNPSATDSKYTRSTAVTG